MDEPNDYAMQAALEMGARYQIGCLYGGTRNRWAFSHPIQ
jgi:hypothetical protein